jgi:hypothetical protein
MKRFLLVASLAMISLFCGSWGFLVHRTVNQLAIYELPKDMRFFFYENREEIVHSAIRPDQRRSKDSTEAPKHFIDMEAFGANASATMPHDWAGAVKMYTRDTLVRYGYLPYWIIVMKERLVNAFRAGNADSIIFYATDMGHYLADANVPLHTSINYDGQLSGQRGIHALWESVIPELEITQYQLHSPHHAEYLSNPTEKIWETLDHSHSLLTSMFSLEKEVSKQFNDSTKYRVQMRNGREVKYYTSTFAKAYSAALQPTINDQLLRSSNLIADFWYTCWVDAGKPDLHPLLKQPLSHDEKKQIKHEEKAWKKNQLIEKGWLISKKEEVKDSANQ